MVRRSQRPETRGGLEHLWLADADPSEVRMRGIQKVVELAWDDGAWQFQHG
jgi:hypothetical protein